jgi:tRNA(adenine34) deaminase
VYGAPEPKTGAIESAARARGAPVATPAFVVVSGVEAAAAAARLRRFFQERRQPAGPEPGGAAPAG